MVKLLTALAVATVAFPAIAFAEAPDKNVTTDTTEAAPLEGANSFTENQARERVVEAGYTNVGAMKKDDKGIWRTTAMKDGASVPVAVDFKGNVTTDDEVSP